MRTFPQLVIDAGAGHVAGAIFVPGTAGRLVLEEFALETRSADPSLEPGWTERTAAALAAVSSRRKLRGPTALAMPGHLTLTKFIKTPVVKPSKRDEVIRFEAAQNIPFPLEAVAWDHLIVSGGDGDIEIMLTAVKLDVLENLCAAAEAAGFRVQRVAASCLALYRAFRFNYPGAALPALVVDVGARSTNLLLVGPGGRFFARTFMLAGNAVTAAVAEELKIDFAAAEALKLRVATDRASLPPESPEPAAVERAGRHFISRLQMEIMRTAGSFRWRSGAELPVRLYVTGGGSLLPGLEAGLAESFKLPVERYDPLQNIDLSDQARAAGAESSVHLLANLIGLAVPVAGEAGSECGLLPPAVRASRTFRRRQRVMLGAATLLALALLPQIRHFHRVAVAEQAQAAELGAQLPPLRELAGRNAIHLAKFAVLRNQILAGRRLLSARSSWVEFLQDLQNRLTQVEDVWLEQLVVVRAVAPVGVEGTTRLIRAEPARELRLSGRLLDAQNPLAKVSPDSYARVQALLAGIASSPFVMAIGDEHFDNTQPGILRFDFTLTVNPQHPL